MKILSSIGSGIASHIAVVIGSIAVVLALNKWRYEKKLGHLAKFVGESSRLSIVTSGLSTQLHDIAHFLVDHSDRCKKMARRAESEIIDNCKFLEHQPPNVVFGPITEGAAVARLYLALIGATRRRRSLTSYIIPSNWQRSRVFINIEAAQEFNLDQVEHPFISIGGPSINPVSERLIRENCPYFDIDYPAHAVSIRGTRCCEASINDEGMLTMDYGFILCGRTRRHRAPFIVIWGVFAYGSLIAARAVIDIANKKYQNGERKKLANREKMFLVVRAQVEGHQILHDRIDPEYMVPEVP